MGDKFLSSLSFKNGSSVSTDILYLRNRGAVKATVTSTSYEYSLTSGDSIGLTLLNDGEGIVGPWDVISNNAGGVTLEILPIYMLGRRH